MYILTAFHLSQYIEENTQKVKTSLGTSRVELSCKSINDCFKEAMPVDVTMRSHYYTGSRSSSGTLKCKIDSLDQGWQCCYLSPARSIYCTHESSYKHLNHSG